MDFFFWDNKADFDIDKKDFIENILCYTNQGHVSTIKGGWITYLQLKLYFGQIGYCIEFTGKHKWLCLCKEWNKAYGATLWFLNWWISRNRSAVSIHNLKRRRRGSLS